MPACLHGQAVSQWNDSFAGGRAVPQPVRGVPAVPGAPAQSVQHRLAHPQAVPSERHTRAWVDQRAVPSFQNDHLQPHQLIDAPDPNRNSGRNHAPSGVLPERLKHYRPIQPRPATLPEANIRPSWKAPYSYGHFGASGTRHWSVHHGYRDRVIEWRLH